MRTCHIGTQGMPFKHHLDLTTKGLTKKPSMEDLLGILIFETRIRFNKDEERIDNMDIQMNNMGASIKSLEVQIGQLATAIQS